MVQPITGIYLAEQDLKGRAEQYQREWRWQACVDSIGKAERLWRVGEYTFESPSALDTRTLAVNIRRILLMMSVTRASLPSQVGTATNKLPLASFRMQTMKTEQSQQKQQQQLEDGFDLQLLPIKELCPVCSTDRQINTEICQQVHIYVYLQLSHADLQRIHNNLQ